MRPSMRSYALRAIKKWGGNEKKESPSCVLTKKQVLECATAKLKHGTKTPSEKPSEGLKMEQIC